MSNIGNLTLSVDEYMGNDQICVGNVASFSICHTGSSHFSSFSKPFCSCVNFYKFQLFRKYQFSSINFLMIIKYFFNLIFFCVKDLVTRKILLHGPTKGNFYLFSQSTKSTPKIAFVGERPSLETWPYRLGHPSHSIVGHILYSNNLPTIGNKWISLNNHKLPFYLSP